MGTKQTKGCPAVAVAVAAPGPQQAPHAGSRRKSPSSSSSGRESRADFLSSLVVRSGEKFGKGPGGGLALPPPYHRRIGMIQDMLGLVRQGRQEEATDLLKHLRQVSPPEGSIAVPGKSRRDRTGVVGGGGGGLLFSSS